MTWKRIVILAVVLAMLISLFAISIGTSTAAPKKVKITRWISYTKNEFDLAQEKRFLAKYPNYEFNDVLQSESGGTDYFTAYASGTNPDLGNVGFPNMTNYAYAGLAMPMDSYINKWKDLPNVNKEVLDYFKINGKRYALPVEAYSMVLNYNKKILAEAGLKAPTNWAEYLDTAKKLTVPEKNQWGTNFLVSYWTEWWFEFFVWEAGGDLTKQNKDGTLTLTFTDPAVVKAVELYRQMIAAKVIQPDLTLDYGNLQKQFALGHAAMTINGSDGAYQYANNGMNIEDVGYAELPAGPGGKKAALVGGTAQFIFANAPKDKADAVWAWISFTQSKEEKEAKLRFEAGRGGTSPQVLIRNDIDVSVGKINPTAQAIVDKCTKTGKLEFYGKGVVGGYVDQALQKCIFDPKADVLKIFGEQQTLAKGAVDDFNKRILASKVKK